MPRSKCVTSAVLSDSTYLLKRKFMVYLRIPSSMFLYNNIIYLHLSHLRVSQKNNSKCYNNRDEMVFFCNALYFLQLKRTVVGVHIDRPIICGE